MLLKVGEVANTSGLTVRTLHHYDEIGLLVPSERSDSGHRLYTSADLARLQQIVSLRQLGFTLDEVKHCLDSPGYSVIEVVRLHIAQLHERIKLQTQLCNQLENLAVLLGRAEEVSAECFLQSIEAMTMIDKYYSPEQLEYLEKRRQEVGEERMGQAPLDWEELIKQVEAEMNDGTPPEDPKAQALAARWQSLIDEFTGGDPGIAHSLNRLWEEQRETLTAQHNMQYDPRLFDYIAKANDARKNA